MNAIRTPEVIAAGDGGSARVVLLGRPNVGKSTLLNFLAGEKYSITSKRAQTTRCQVGAYSNAGNTRVLWLDTPGISFRHRHILHKVMHRNAMSTIHDADIVVFMVEALRWLAEDERVLRQLQQYAPANMLLAVNKCDRLRSKNKLLPYLAELVKIDGLAGSRPLLISARSGKGVNQLTAAVETMLQGTSPTDSITSLALNDNADARCKWYFLAAELMREKLIRRLSDELPHQLFVKTESMREDDNITHFDLDIIVASKGQKAIVIGAGGKVLKQVGTQVRLELEKRLGTRVNIKSMVKLRANWFNDYSQLAEAAPFSLK